MAGEIQLNGTSFASESGGTITLNNGTLSSSVVFPAGGTGNPISVAVIVDQKSSGTDGGDFTQGAWRDRDLNTELSDSNSIVSISANAFTLSAGTYVIEWSCPAFMVNLHQTRLYDVTGGAVVAAGMSCYADTTNVVMNVSLGSAVHTISGNNSYKIQHRSGNTKAGNGFGNANSLDTEIYTIVKISKLK